jgi:putative ABC transport system substrate-binding protein
MHDLGYVEGQNLVIERRDAEGRLERLPALAEELVAARVEVIVARDSTAARPASRATSTIPIVAASGNVVPAGLVTNLAHPEGNITGVSTNALETVGKWVELLKETVPSISRLAVVRDPSIASEQGERTLQQAERAARTLRLPTTAYELRDLDRLSSVLSTVQSEGADGVLVLSGGVIAGSTDPRIGREVLRSRLPAVGEGRGFAANGGLLAHGIRPGVLPRRAAVYVDRLLKGAKPGDLPIKLPTEFHIVVNLKTAQELGVAVPQSIMQRVTEVIE